MSSSSSDSSLSSSHKRRERKRKRQKTNHHAEAAPSDYAQLRKHFQFVLPDTNDASASGQKYGTTWQQRMVQHYHSHLYKEYVLADLSRVLTGNNGRGGPVGLRWRTEAEVKDGKGFQTCGNLACMHTKKTTDEEYTRKVRSALGVGVAENGGSVPTGVLLPNDQDSQLIERYLQSCEREERKDERKGRKRKDQKSSESRDTSKRREGKEQKRLSRLSYGLGLHDYEVDFAYVEQNQKKRELVKVRLCLRCAPLIFDGWAVKARRAREKAAKDSAGTESAVTMGDNRKMENDYKDEESQSS
ncbi:hypothetical protein ACHAXN_013123 [Cyclotella atomus]